MAEESNKKKIAAMEAWAIDAKKKADDGDYKEAEADLRSLNLQGRKLEWRKGSLGIRDLPDLDEVKQLKKDISSVRAAAQNAQSSIHDLIKLLPKKEGKGPAEAAAIGIKESSLKRDADKEIMMAINGLKQARAIFETEPWLNLAILCNHRKVLESFLRGDGFYRDYSHEIRIEQIWNSMYSKIKLDLSGAHLEKADLRGAIFIWANLRGARLEGANLWGALLRGADLSGAHLEGAILICDLSRANLRGAHLEKADLEKADLNEADLLGAYLNNVKNLTAKQLRLAKNWDKAISIPPYLLVESRAA
jgi:uncharacterized protein YjbI with pentapeptide repeats